jgi:hypothetical protein
MKINHTAAIVAAAVALSGCATVIKGSSQTVGITTPPTTGAACILTSGQGNWTVTSPGAVTVERSKEDIQARCTKAGWQDAVAIIPSNFEGWTVGNFILGGVIGFGVDAATGAINEYPHSFQIPMTPLAGTSVPVAQGAPPPAAAPATSAPVAAAPTTPAGAAPAATK